jgi:lipopolysaccharide/colanic/teichoic acid biosynthesis glycosyltransferase
VTVVADLPRIVKRVFDITVSLVALLVTLPLSLLVSIATVLVLGPPVLFLQERAGLRGRTFRLYKFRTMAETGNAIPQTASDEERLSGFGRFVRRTSLDELPQLWNVLKGDMSLVGPRPLLVEYVPLYSQEQSRRLLVKPGITGWAQIRGRNALSWEEKFTHDVWYVDNWTPLLDLKILALTITLIVRGVGMSRAGHATAPRFLGSGDE